MDAQFSHFTPTLAKYFLFLFYQSPISSHLPLSEAYHRILAMPDSDQMKIKGTVIRLTTSGTLSPFPEDQALAVMGLACNMPLSKPASLPNGDPYEPHDHCEPTFSPPPPRLWFEAHSQFSQQAANYLWYGPSPDWWSINRVGQKSFIDFVRRDPPYYLNDENSVLPATTRAVTEWITQLGAMNVRSDTLKSYLMDVRTLHTDAGYPTTVLESPIVQSLIRGIKRVHEGRPAYPRLPVTIDIVRQLCAASSDGLHHAGLRAAITVAFAAFLRLSEFTVPAYAAYDPAIHLSRGCVQFLPNISSPTHVALSIPASKTDPFRSKGATVLMASAPGALTCPVAALKTLFERDPRPSSAPLFSGGTPGQPLNRVFFILFFCAVLSGRGIDTTKLSGFSFRRGAAVAAEAVGFSQDEIRLLGRWRSDADRLYREVSQDRILQLSARLHSTEVAAHAF